ncbi:MAG: murein L,D-transpeptidase family protein [Pseudomonadota bacterium]
MRWFLNFLAVLQLTTVLCACEPVELTRHDNEYSRLETGAEVFVRIFKAESELELWLKAPQANSFELKAVFPICRWSGDLGPKLREGDGQSPEGFYRVTRASLNPNSSFHLSFNLGFPNRYDRAHSRTGSYLMVHGACVSVGCYAMTDAGIEKIYAAVESALKGGQDAVDVHIFPFRMTSENLALREGHEWYEFWLNLKEGYDAFEEMHRVPNIGVNHKRYTFQTAHVP